MLLEVDLAGKNSKLDPTLGMTAATIRKTLGKAGLDVRKDIEAAGAFLKEHETAKIIVSIDTHCLEENGLLVYSDDDRNNLGACRLLQVRAVLAQH